MRRFVKKIVKPCTPFFLFLVATQFAYSETNLDEVKAGDQLKFVGPAPFGLKDIHFHKGNPPFVNFFNGQVSQALPFGKEGMRCRVDLDKNKLDEMKGMGITEFSLIPQQKLVVRKNNTVATLVRENSRAGKVLPGVARSVESDNSQAEYEIEDSFGLVTRMYCSRTPKEGAKRITEVDLEAAFGTQVKIIPGKLADTPVEVPERAFAGRPSRGEPIKPKAEEVSIEDFGNTQTPDLNRSAGGVSRGAN